MWLALFCNSQVITFISVQLKVPQSVDINVDFPLSTDIASPQAQALISDDKVTNDENVSYVVKKSYLTALFYHSVKYLSQTQLPLSMINPHPYPLAHLGKLI